MIYMLIYLSEWLAVTYFLYLRVWKPKNARELNDFYDNICHFLWWKYGVGMCYAYKPTINNIVNHIA